MLSIGLIVFREVIEIALIVSVVFAASQGRSGRGLWTGIGLLGGVAGSAVIALFAEALTRAADGMGQEMFNAIILFAAAVLIGGTAVWMRTHARQATEKLRNVGVDVRNGRLPLYSLAIVTALAVWREGSEIVLFLYGMSISGQPVSALITGSLLGFAGGTLMGVLLYYGLLKMAARKLFQVTGILLVLVAAGMASQGVKLLVDAGMITHFTQQLWDTSTILSEKNLLGQTLHALLGYTAKPLAVQVMTYIATAVFLFSSMRVVERAPQQLPNAA